MLKQISVEELKALKDAGTPFVLDVREIHEFNDGHVPGAISIPMALIPLKVSELPRNEALYVICEAGGRSAQSCMWLEQQGYDVTNVVGGTGTWRMAGFEVEK